ncbi:MAG: DUF2085 domain-containing protein [Chloroflexia bacterium]|nr:DUF2085 domain-containing protein [Chloroflexia bacterium]MDQ3513180.1 DUF2085 domain-containing protein [Chloroflexota bacterium]
MVTGEDGVTDLAGGSISGPVTERASVRAIIAANRGMYQIARHWLAISNGLAALFALLPLAAPLLLSAGADRAAGAIDGAFWYLCHQRDDRSFHLAGERVACCHRCLAIYGGLFLAGLAFTVVRTRVGPLRLPLASLLVTPVLVDVLTQPIFGRESAMVPRVVTGLLFALAVNWVALPRLDAGFAGIRAQIETRFARLVAAGRVTPLPGTSR